MEYCEDKFTFLVLITHLIGAELGLNIYIVQELELYIKSLFFFILYFFEAKDFIELWTICGLCQVIVMW